MNSAPQQTSSGPRKRCANCAYFPLEPLANLREDEIQAPPTVDSYAPTNRTWGLIAPEAVLSRILLSWLGVLFLDAWKVRRKRARIRRARREVLPRNPQALACRGCGDVLEVLD